MRPREIAVAVALFVAVCLVACKVEGYMYDRELERDQARELGWQS